MVQVLLLQHRLLRLLRCSLLKTARECKRVETTGDPSLLHRRSRTPSDEGVEGAFQRSRGSDYGRWSDGRGVEPTCQGWRRNRGVESACQGWRRNRGYRCWCIEHVVQQIGDRRRWARRKRSCHDRNTLFPVLTISAIVVWQALSFVTRRFRMTSWRRWCRSLPSFVVVSFVDETLDDILGALVVRPSRIRCSGDPAVVSDPVTTAIILLQLPDLVHSPIAHGHGLAAMRKRLVSRLAVAAYEGLELPAHCRKAEHSVLP